MGVKVNTLKEGFGKKLKELRKQKKLTQEQLSEILSLTPRQLTRIECGRSFPSVDTLARLCLILNIELTQLFDFSWDCELTLLSSSETGEYLYIKSVDGVIDTEKYLKNEIIDSASDLDFSSLAKINKKTIIVEYFELGKRKEIKTFLSNGNVENTVSKDKIKNFLKMEMLMNKIKKFSESQKRLEFIDLSIDALSSKKALQELKSVIKGMELN